MAGNSSRFYSAGYSEPKALLPVGGSKMIEHVINMFDPNICKYHIVVNSEQLVAYPNLKKILSDEKVTKIFHYGRADMAHIKYYLKTETKNILDTKIASKLARSYSDSHSLKALIKEFINIDISKQFQSSDFGGELTPAQLKYCANDVLYLHKIHLELNKILVRENRINLYEDCLKFLKTRVDLDLALFKDDIWSH